MKPDELEYLYLAMKDLARGPRSVVVEIGSWTGSSTVHIARGIRDFNKGASLVCVDPFSKESFSLTPNQKRRSTEIDVLGKFREHMEGFNYVVLRGQSVDVAPLFLLESVDFVLIDGDHTYKGAKADIKAWWPKVVRGGIMCGHDYGKARFGVTKAVKKYVKDYTVPAYSIWETHKT